MTLVSNSSTRRKRRTITRVDSESSLDPNDLLMHSSSSSSCCNNNNNDNWSEQRRGSVELLHQSLDGILDRRRRLSMDVCEHKHLNGSSSNKVTSSAHRLPPRGPSLSSDKISLGTDDAVDNDHIDHIDDDNDDDDTAADSTDSPSTSSTNELPEDTTASINSSSSSNASNNASSSDDLGLSTSSFNVTTRTTCNEGGRSHSRGRGLFRGLSRKINKLNNSNNKNDSNEDWALPPDGTSRAGCSTSTLMSDSQQQPSLSINNKRSLLQKVDSIRMNHHRPSTTSNRNSSNNKDTKKGTALEESLMQQLAHTHATHETELAELNLKLQQREAAIATLERALTIKTETVDSLRIELDATVLTLEEVERNLKRKERKETNLNQYRTRSASPISTSEGVGSSRRRLKEKKPSDRNLLRLQGTTAADPKMEMSKATLGRNKESMCVKKLVADATALKQAESNVAAATLRRPQSDHPRTRRIDHDNDADDNGGCQSEHYRKQARPSDDARKCNTSAADDDYPSIRTRSSTNRSVVDDHDMTTQQQQQCVDNRNRRTTGSAIEDLHRYRLAAAGRRGSSGEAVRQKTNSRSPRRESSAAANEDDLSSRLCMDSLPTKAMAVSSRRVGDGKVRSRSREAGTDRAAGGADSRGDSRGRGENHPRRDEQQRNGHCTSSTTDTPRSSSTRTMSLSEKIEQDKKRAEQRQQQQVRGPSGGRRGSEMSKNSGINNNKRTPSASRSCVDAPRRLHETGERSTSINVRSTTRTPSRGRVQRTESARFSSRPSIIRT